MIVILRIIFVLFAASPFCVIAQSADGSLLERGEYLLRISGCIHCHTAEGGDTLAGGRALETPFGTFYTPNITAHKTTGIGAWSADEFRRALHEGIAPDDSDYYPAFPYTSYTRMSSEDVNALHAYIQSLPESDLVNRDHELAWYVSWRIAAWGWKRLFFSAGELQQNHEQSAQWNRGAYIAEALGHCGECHTPRNIFGALRTDQTYAGNAQGPEDEKVPNITPHEGTGIGKWSRAELVEFLKFGELPDGEYAAGSMDPVIEGLQKLTPEDRDALIEYLRNLSPIDNDIND